MEMLSRMALYNAYKEKMNDDSSKFNNNGGNKGILLKNLLDVNCMVLEGIEELFITSDFIMPENRKEDANNLGIIEKTRANNRKLNEHILNFEEKVSNVYNADLKKEKKLIEKLLVQLEKLIQGCEDNPKEIYLRRLFSKIIKELAEFNNKSIYFEQLTVCENSKVRECNQIFLSHAYVDKLYSYILFRFFCEKNIYLYVDWMHNEEIKDGRELKKILERELRYSRDLLFLRTPNSELNIQGKNMLRPWCAWELGNYYSKGDNRKYIINLYSVDGYKNVQLHGMKLLKGIDDFGNLSGIEIEP